MAAQPKYNALYHDDWAWSMAAMGATNEEIADAIGVSKRTIIRWAKEHESFGEALKAGRMFFLRPLRRHKCRCLQV